MAPAQATTNPYLLHSAIARTANADVQAQCILNVTSDDGGYAGDEHVNISWGAWPTFLAGNFTNYNTSAPCTVYNRNGAIVLKGTKTDPDNATTNDAKDTYVTPGAPYTVCIDASTTVRLHGTSTAPTACTVAS